jgi:regulator of sigma E protease
MLPSIVIFLIVLSVLIFIHELGHFLAAKKSGIRVEEFGFGYPPRIWGKRVGETIYSINWIPFGGFVRLLGQEKREKKKWSRKETKRAFFAQSKKRKILVLLAGILGNFFLGTACFSLIYSQLGIPKKLGYVKVVAVVESGPAAKAGLKERSQITAVGEEKISSVEEFVEIIEKNKGQEILVITREGRFPLVPRENPPEEEGRLGVVITDIEMVFYPWWQMPFRGAWEGIKEAMLWSAMVFGGVILTIKQLLMGIPPEVAGPVGIFQLTTAAAEEGILALIQFVGILSVNLAVLNLLPFPALDGGHVLFIFLGGLLSEQKREKVEHIVNTVGFIFLISLMILVTINDFMRLFQNFSLISFLKSISLFQPFLK